MVIHLFSHLAIRIMKCAFQVGIATFLFALLTIPTHCLAQVSSPLNDLLKLLPEEFALGLAIRDLRANVERWEKSPWLKSLKASALGKDFFNSPEFKDLLKFQNDLEKHLNFDWPTFRDEVLGDAVVLAYQPGPSQKAGDEQGILMLHARKPEVLIRLVENVNKVQLAGGELKSVETREYKGAKYFCRVEPKVSHYYVINGPFFAYTAQEELLKRILEQKLRNNSEIPPLALTLKKAGAENAVVSLWVNPRALDAELNQKTLGIKAPEDILLKSFLTNWKAFDALVFSLSVTDHLECRLSILAREKDLPASTRKYFMEPAVPPEIWKRFPENAIFRLAGRLEGSEVVDSILDTLPADFRQNLDNSLQPLAALAGFDFIKDLAPNVGPDWGVCILPALDSNKMPQIIAALGVRPGPKDLAIDQALFRGVHFLAGLALFENNRRHPDNPIRINTKNQDKVEIKYLSNDKVFPQGIQPACALKNGYLLLTTSPDAISQFVAGPVKIKASTEAPLLSISSPELVKALRQNRLAIIDNFADKSQNSKKVAEIAVENTLSFFDLIDRIEIVRRSGPGQMSFILRISPALEK